jgi:hypothetical protein
VIESIWWSAPDPNRTIYRDFSREDEMETKAVFGFAIIFALLIVGVVGMFIVGRPGKRRKWPTDVGHGGDGGLGGGFSGGSGSDFSGTATYPSIGSRD